MVITVKKQGEYTTIELSGRVDDGGATELEQEILGLGEDDLHQVRLDFTAVTFIGSAGIGKLLMLYKLVSEVGGNVALAGMPAQMQLIFQTFRLDRLFSLAGGETQDAWPEPGRRSPEPVPSMH